MLLFRHPGSWCQVNTCFRFVLSVLSVKLYKPATSSSCGFPCRPRRKKSGNVALSPPIKLQSTNEDGVRRRITSNILSCTQAPSFPATKLASKWRLWRLRSPSCQITTRSHPAGVLMCFPPTWMATSCLPHWCWTGFIFYFFGALRWLRFQSTHGRTWAITTGWLGAQVAGVSSGLIRAG